MKSNENPLHNYSNTQWTLRYGFGLDVFARKRYATGLYQLRADFRHCAAVFCANRVQARADQLAKMTLDNAYQPWWMSQNQYQQMLTRLGMPF